MKKKQAKRRMRKAGKKQKIIRVFGKAGWDYIRAEIKKSLKESTDEI